MSRRSSRAPCGRADLPVGLDARQRVPTAIQGSQSRTCSENSRISRRAALGRLGAGALLALGAWPGALQAQGQGNGGAFRFLVVNDTHCMSAQCEGYLDGLVRQMKTEGADFCLHAGDVTEKGEKKYLGMAKSVFAGLRRPMYPVIGNHDYVRARDRQSYTRTFPLRMNYYFLHEGWQFIGLDSSEGVKFENTEIQPATFQWLDDYLWRLSKRKPTVIFTHFPMGTEVTYRPRNADALLERFLDFNLQAVFCGHFHGFTERVEGPVTLTTNRCCALKRGNHDGTTEKGYFVCETREGTVARRFVEYKPDGAPGSGSSSRNAAHA